ncbi:crotonase/enoyl-CoA hydratase family protein [Verticiella sediminum]|uniref:Crotonase/enoyl-CoA hydratase family protein n=1 Tax=Verticiella sediminum TaxID=1247510 RepID=A0A556AGL3_9BURK|nr:enoyl-CoA hydratase-related protein [Verticiella sediminum]TSH92026.1 crotonase/enoyl-CoA hydratase family protein [Verticiella sediminum]
MTPTPHLLVERHDGVAVVTLNRPEKRNALSPEMVVRLAAFWQSVADDDSVRAVVVTGAGHEAFCAGGDLGTLIPLMMRTRAPQDEWEIQFAQDRKQLHAALLRSASFFKPVIAAINGNALAGGAEFVMSTDLRVMSDAATIGVTEVRRGLIASGGSLVRMARQVPWAHAMELLLLGEPVGAERALAMGLVNRVVPPEEVLPTALDLARRVSLGAPVALEKTKEVVVLSSGRPLEEAFAIETRCTKENAATEDAKEGPRAFMEKRPPVFRGRAAR